MLTASSDSPAAESTCRIRVDNSPVTIKVYRTLLIDLETLQQPVDQ